MDFIAELYLLGNSDNPGERKPYLFHSQSRSVGLFVGLNPVGNGFFPLALSAADKQKFEDARHERQAPVEYVASSFVNSAQSFTGHALENGSNLRLITGGLGGNLVNRCRLACQHIIDFSFLGFKYGFNKRIKFGDVNTRIRTAPSFHNLKQISVYLRRHGKFSLFSWFFDAW